MKSQAVKPIIRRLLAAFLVGMALPITAQPQRSTDRKPAGPCVGDKAPDFKLKTKDCQREVQLSNFKVQKPVAHLYETYHGHVEFFIVYIKEGREVAERIHDPVEEQQVRPLQTVEFREQASTGDPTSTLFA